LSCILFLTAIIFLAVRRRDLNRTVFKLLLASLIASFASELASSIAKDFNDTLNLSAHLAQLVSLYFLYKAFIEWGIREPSALLFQNLSRSENELRKERDFMNALLQTTNALVVVLDVQGRIVRFNRTCEAITGYNSDEIAGKSVADTLIPAEEREEILALLQEHFDGRLHSRLENHWVDKDGGRRWIAWSNTILTEAPGKVKYIVCTGIDITERKQVQQALEQEALRYRTIMNASMDGIYTIDSAGNLLECNNAFLRNLGYSREEAQLLHVWDWNAQWCREEIIDIVRTQINQGTIFETRHRRKDGSLVDVEINATSVMLDGKLLLCSSVRNITERKRAEAALQESDQRYLSILHTSRDPILLLEGMNFIECNEATCKILGFANREDVFMTKPSQLSPPTQPDGRDSHEKADEMIKTAFEKGFHSFEWMHRKANGEDFLVVVSLTPITLHGKSLLQSHWHDITEFKRAEQLRALMMKRLEGQYVLQDLLLLPMPMEEKFQVITDTAVELLDLDSCNIWMIRPGDLCDSGCFHADAADRKHGCRNRGKCLHPITTSGNTSSVCDKGRCVPLNCPQINWVATGEADRNSTVEIDGDSQADFTNSACRIGLAYKCYKLLNMRNETTGVLAVSSRHPLSADDDALLDNMAKKTSKLIIDHETEEKLLQAQKLESVGQLAGGVAHEFNNLLQVIEGYTRYGMEGLDPEEDRCRDLQQVLEAADRAATLTRQLLGFSRHKAIQPKSVDANLVVRDLIKLIRPTIGKLITVMYFLGDDVDMVYADAVDLQQALLNLCLNARDAMPAGGKLTVKTEKVVIDSPFQDSQFEIQPGPYVVFGVSDTGSGIPREIQHRIFEPFFTTKEVGKGTGLGLSMVYGMVRQHKGAIQVESEAGKGTSFKLYMPSENKLAAEEGLEEFGADLQERETILVAEDDPSMQYLIIHILKGAGYMVLIAADGEEAIRLFEEQRTKIALVVLDVMMPKRTGPEVYRYLQSVDCGIKVMFCTGVDQGAAPLDGLECENIPQIRKPFNKEFFLAKVREVLDAPSLCPQDK
jgi:PAS domain S-box-containing protein